MAWLITPTSVSDTVPSIYMHIIIICLREWGKKKQVYNTFFCCTSAAGTCQCLARGVAGMLVDGSTAFWCLASASQQPGNTTIITKACSHKRRGKQQLNIHAIFLQFNIAPLRTQLTLIYPDADSTSVNSKTHLINFSNFFFFRTTISMLK